LEISTPLLTRFSEPLLLKIAERGGSTTSIIFCNRAWRKEIVTGPGEMRQKLGKVARFAGLKLKDPKNPEFLANPK